MDGVDSVAAVACGVDDVPERAERRAAYSVQPGDDGPDGRALESKDMDVP
jgi:hypothetical protein